MNVDEVLRLRDATPGCAQVIHFNHAGASLPSQATLDAVIGQLQREALGGPMETADIQVQERARSAAAALLNAQPEDIAFASSGSAAWSQAFNALGPWHSGERILVGRHEWAGNLACMAEAVKAGARLEVIPCDARGAVDPQALAQMIDRHVRLIALTWLPANGGLINPAAQIGAIARRHGIPYFVDAGQALGQLPCDVQALQCDMLKGAARKFLRGPRGTALMYIRPEFLQRLLPVQRDVLSAPWDGQRFTLRDDARRFETSEVSLALLAGLANALEEHQRIGATAIRKRIVELSQPLRRRMKEIPGLTLLDLGSANEQSGLIAFTLDGWDCVALKQALAERRINIGANGVAYTPLDMQARGLNSIARVSVSYLNTAEEIDILLTNLAELAAQPQISMSTHKP
ncbi:aminotransferase [Pseudomonas sp. FW215-R2]|uniref:aminotransferase class V-fold PLP-dependent enzyme n=1 Tax=unclassified Pseudomonas TaxID=196821 RepID=UPI000C888371|nr:MULTISPECIES: aminotransferase class V-fold PLP-dependent enzyme [unclassified Pseudomonas]PMX01466.1 aminotransferase [Pseudomonas sp. FW215-R2]PMX07839.1 aminotransferase [Pseudomonas sp. FW215-L1]PMX21754.1 aminotransferase [Pseudomonas sp. FW215-E1]PNA26709.1 aminotransferase [Pseudomonas sp. FW215-R4]